MNSINLIGRLTATPELKATKNDTKVTSFSLAVDRPYAKKDDPNRTGFIRVVAWRQLAEVITKYTEKGMRIGITGTLQTRQYEKDGVKSTVVEVIANQMYFADGPRGNKGSNPDFEEIPIE